MPWDETSAMDQKRLFVADYLTRSFTIVELCRRFGITRPTAYKWIHRFLNRGYQGLDELPRRPSRCPHRTPDEQVEVLLELRRKHPTWGPKKLLRVLSKRRPAEDWPARSTVAHILKRHGVVEEKRRRAYLGHPGKPMTAMDHPNDVWCADYKGEFKTRDGIYCYPLTVTDGCSRYLLECKALLSTEHILAKPIFARLFRGYGMPRIIRTDNGTPFASTAIGRLSRLSVWWIRLGIFPELIQPGRPAQNGRHERMHKTLKRETTRPPAASLRGQQIRFNRFREEFNNERPHEALDQETPASVYQRSTREYPERLPPIEYPGHFEKRLVSRNGGFRWGSIRVPITQTLEEQYVGLEEVDEGKWDVYFSNVRLGQMDERTFTIKDALGNRMRKRTV
jgi:transposase InsO family protein